MTTSDVRCRYSGTDPILSKARSLAMESRRPIITTSCLLFAFSELAEEERNTSRFVRDVLDRKGEYQEAFQHFLIDAREVYEEDAVEGLSWKVSANARNAIEHAVDIASRVNKECPEVISERHLFAALLVAPWTGHPPTARRRLQHSGLDLTRVSLEFLQFVRVMDETDDRKEWQEILGCQSPRHISTASVSGAPGRDSFLEEERKAKIADSFVSGSPGYSTEFCGVGGDDPVSDELGVEKSAELLAELIVLRETKLPLAVGLFGNWGSGKSHFMNLMDRHMKWLVTHANDSAESSGAEANPGGKWCKQIVPIYFNAWHYSDCNLWASLVTEIFDKLFAHLRPKANELELLHAQLQEAGGVTARAVEEVKNAEEHVRKATEALEEARRQSNHAKQFLAGLVDGLRTLVPEVDTPRNRERVVALLGIEAEAATFSDLVARRKELSSLAGWARELWQKTTGREGIASRITGCTGAILAILLALVLLPLLSSHLRILLMQVMPWMKGLLVVVGGAAGWLLPVVGQIRDSLLQLQKWERKAEAAQATLPEDSRVREARNASSNAEARARSAETTLEAARLREQNLAQALNELRPERRLSSFIEARAQSSDYRGQLGLVSLARRDFEKLSDIFTDAEGLSASGGLSTIEEADLQSLSSSIDRVILFIDDLDRCDPDKVVDVLQAVHLLLAFPLFAVIVGVDQRCLKQSLRIRLKGLLTPPCENDKGHAGQEDSAADRQELPATPLDYLEKIFHIVFQLPPMSAQGFGRLVEKLTEPMAPGRPQLSDVVSSSTGMEAVALKGKPLAVFHATGMPAISQNESGIGAEEKLTAPSATINDAPKRADVQSVGSVPLYSWERTALREFHSVIHTPRGAIRFLNTYRLVRAELSLQEWDSFRGDDGGKQEFRIAMLLLAVAAGQPAVVREWFEEVRRLEPGEMLSEDSWNGKDYTGWSRFCELYSQTSRQLTTSFTQPILIKWLDRVERFTF